MALEKPGELGAFFSNLIATLKLLLSCGDSASWQIPLVFVLLIY